MTRENEIAFRKNEGSSRRHRIYRRKKDSVNSQPEKQEQFHPFLENAPRSDSEREEPPWLGNRVAANATLLLCRSMTHPLL